MSEDVSAGYTPGSSGYRRVVASLVAAGVATFALIYSTQALLPKLANDFNVSSADSALSLSLTTAALGITLLVAGPLSDRVGRTVLIHASLITSAVIAAATALAPTWPTFLGLRLLQGIAIAGLPAVATAYLREELHARGQARAAGLYIAGTAIGGMIGRLATGGIAGVWGWRWALGATAALGLACALIVRVALPASRRFTPREAGLKPMVAMARKAVSDRGLLALYAIAFLGQGAFVAVYNALGFRLTTTPFALGVGAASLVYLVYAFGSAGSALAGRAADTLGRATVVPIGAVIALVGVLVTAAPNLALIVLGMGAMTAGFFALHGVASGWVPVRAHAVHVAGAQAASLYLCAFYAGSSVFGSVGTMVWSYAAWPGVVCLAAALFAGVIVLSVVVRWRIAQ